MRTTSVPSGILIHPTVWPHYTNVTDRQDRHDNGPVTCNSRRKIAQLVTVKALDFSGPRVRLRNRQKLECGPMPNLMAALPNIGGALCSTPQSLADSSTRVPCSNAAKTRNPLEFARVSQTHQQFSAVSGPKFPILQGHVGRYCCLTSFFSGLSIHALVAKTNLCDCAQMANFWRFFCVLHFQRAACSTLQTCILNSH